METTKSPINLYAIALGFALVHFLLGFSAIQRLSPIFDEHVHITDGYVNLTQRYYGYNGLDHPPLARMWTAAPLLFMHPHFPADHPLWLEDDWRSEKVYKFADYFMYESGNNPDRILTATRCMQLLLSCLFCLALGWIAYRVFSVEVSILTMALWAINPVSLAHGSLVTTDLAFAIFFFLFFASLTSESSNKGILLSALFFAGCLTTKYFCIALIPCSVALYCWKMGFKPRFDKILMKRALVIFLIGLFVVGVIYQFTGFKLFERGLRYTFRRASFGDEAFLMGQHSQKSWWYYSAFTFISKTPLALLSAFFLAIVLALKKKIHMPARFVIPPLVFMALICFSNKQIGHRYILCVYPFVCLAAAVGLASLKGKWKWASALVVGVLCLETVLCRPFYLSFINAAFGGPSQGYKWLGDSNVDWGQGLKELSRKLSAEDKKKGIYLAYFGVGDPHYYGIRYLQVTPSSFDMHPVDNSKENLSPSTFVISATVLQGRKANPHPYEWLESYKPVDQIGYSLFVYDFSDKPKALGKLEGMLKK